MECRHKRRLGGSERVGQFEGWNCTVGERDQVRSGRMLFKGQPRELAVCIKA